LVVCPHDNFSSLRRGRAKGNGSCRRLVGKPDYQRAGGVTGQSLTGVTSHCGRSFGVHVDDRAGQDERWLRIRQVVGEQRVQLFE
jgi:hypothetical protein